MLRILLMFSLSIISMSTFAKLHKLEYKESAGNVIEIKFADYLFYTTAEYFLKSKIECHYYLPDSLMQVIHNHQSSSDTLHLVNPEDYTYFLEKITYTLIQNNDLTNIIKSSTNETIDRLKIKKAKFMCTRGFPRTWVWKGFDVIFEKQNIFTVVTRRRIIHCFDVKF
ncbi:MAG: hypothetical protein H6600_07660 [Flavobacteriales bacterium]|nr:hypothetical protein [Flavobacteriales bacterium]MCB9198319.1 hypothetical protein [Flavobacteriales bacterium]